MQEVSVDCCVTSPPYWALRDYGLKPIIWGGDKQCVHEWKAGNTTINIGASTSSTLRNGKPRNEKEKYIGKSHNVQNGFCLKCGAWEGQLGLESNYSLYVDHLCEIFDNVQRVLKAEGTCWVNLGDTYGPNKSLCMIPSRFAIEMCNRGWILRNTIIWHKPNCMPCSVKDRFTVDFEYLFFFVKNKRYWFETQYEPTLSKPSARKAIKGKSNGRVIGSGYGRMCGTSEKGRNKRTTWSIPTRSFNGAHFAVYPQDLIEIPIKAGSPLGGVVLDPFMGSGTTAIVAKTMGRSYVGFEQNKEYIEIANERIGKACC